MNPKPIITQERVKELLDYRDGKLFWKKRVSKRIKIGDRAGWLDSHSRSGYRRIAINGKAYSEARLIFLWYYGYLPKQVDHINRIRNDNRIENLRESTNSQNQMNKKKRNGCSSIYKGVCFNKVNNKWQASIRLNEKPIYLGLYTIEREAALAYNKKAIELFGKFAHLNEV